MQRFKRILVFNDGGPRGRVVLVRAAALAERNKARITLFSVLESLPRELQRLSAAIHPSELWELAVQERQKVLGRLVARAGKQNVGIAVRISGGTPFIEVIKEVLRENHDLVMMAADGSGGVRNLLFGSTSAHLMRKCPCPVWVVKSGRSRTFSKVLAAVDPDSSDQGHNLLNLKILQLAASLSRLEGSQLHVIHAWVPASRWLRLAGSRLAESELEQIDRSSEAAHSIGFGELLGNVPLNDLDVSRHMLKGEPSHLIARLARAKGIDVIVMGTVCRSGVPGLIIGNTAETVLGQVNCSVLTVKPEGFVSPVEA